MIRRPKNEDGYAAVMVALLASVVLMGLAAFGVDTARWYVEAERVQKVADSAALAGVTYMPGDIVKARSTALAQTAKNGFTHGVDGVTVTVAEGTRPSQLKVTITSVIPNAFGASFGVDEAPITRAAVADYTSPAPMGSPCNTFGNEPPSTSTAALPAGSALPATPFPNCTSSPQFWAAIEGTATDKVQGDRYMTQPCTTAGNAGATYECASSKNKEYAAEGYFWAIHVEAAAKNVPIDVQIYDPAYIQTGVNCASLAGTDSLSTGAANNMNIYVPSDAVARYAASTSTYCPGDYVPGSVTGVAPDTTFVMREQTDSHDPMQGAVINNCTKQFRGTTTAPRNVGSSLTAGGLKRYTSGTTNNQWYNPELARVFHQWVSLCTFTPTREGDYYLQVRTNVSYGGTPVLNTNATGKVFSPIVYTGNGAAAAPTGNTTTGIGLNSFSLRAVPSDSTKRNQVAVAGFARMPILQNASGSTAKFNLIRALPQTAGQYVAFDFYDAGDGASTDATVRVIAPTDATGSIKSGTNIAGCQGAKNGASLATLSNCTATIKNTTHDGQLQNMVIPIPSDYNCNPTTLGGCWFQVEIKFPGTVTDFTTWDANIGGDPVRLIE
jgi:Flp pilus assembly protein TadG